MKLAANTVIAIRRGFTSFQIDQALTITEGDERHKCPENWVNIIDTVLTKMRSLTTKLEGEDPDDYFDGDISHSSDPDDDSDD